MACNGYFPNVTNARGRICELLDDAMYQDNRLQTIWDDTIMYHYLCAMVYTMMEQDLVDA